MQVDDLNGLTASEAKRRVAQGQIETTALLGACRARIAEREADVRAWVYLTPEHEQSRQRAMSAQAPLADIPVGIKDIMDTHDMPTAWGTDYLYASSSPADAAAVALLRRAGAIVLGKTVSTELAYFTPGKTRNPHDSARTPGGSSSGSAAAVADRMVPLALGSQTAGSIIRPASFCGVVGFKPTFDAVPLAGVKGFSPSLDTVGWFARSVEDIALAHGALTASATPSLDGTALRGLRVGIRGIPDDAPLDADAARVLDDARRALVDAGAHVADLDLPSSYDDLVSVQQRVMAYEAARTLAYEYNHFRERMGPKLVALLDEGLTITPEHYRAALRTAAEHRRHIAERFTGVDVILTPSAIGEAPLGHEATGDPVYCRAWTLLGLPCISLPLGTGAHGMPIGMQFIGSERADAKLLGIAREVMNACA